MQQISISREPKNLEGLLYKFYRLRNPGNLALRTYFWTAVSGTAFCATSFVLLAAIVRLLGDEGPYWGGVFSIVLALSQQLITVGLFQMRPFQVSDLDEVFTFSDYFFSRILTTALMFVMGFAWMIFGGMGHDKIIALLLLLVVRAGESISDVIEGRYQQAGRFDIASKGVFFKTLLPLIIFIIALWAWRNMFTALAAMAIAHSLLLAATDGILIRSFANISLAGAIKNQRKLLLACLPLATNAFLFIYINNLSRYSVDHYLDEHAMATYNALFMPSFGIALVSGFALRPAMTLLSEQRRSADRKDFSLEVLIQLGWVIVFSIPVLILTYLWGAQVLSLMYGLDLTAHRGSLFILIASGALLAIYRIFQAVLIILRRQMACLAGILLATAAAWPITAYTVRNHGIRGGAFSYFLTTSILAGLFMLMTVWYTYREFTERSCQNAKNT